MKKEFILLLLCSATLAFSEETFENKSIEEEVKEIIKDKQLNYLFDKSKFPTNDYIYKGGFETESGEKIKIETDENKKGNEEPKQEEKKPNIVIKEDNNETQKNLQEIQQRLQNLQNQARKPQATPEQIQRARIKNLIKDSILADRTGEIKYLHRTNKFGDSSFSNQENIDIATNEHKLYRTIRAGRLIPALLTSSISSDLNGIITAQIEQDIYASMGNAVLIPRGSKAIGFYQNNTSIGQNRLEIAWREIITPHGVNIRLTDSIVADNMGMSGAKGAVNNKYWDRYALPLGISTLSNALLLGIASKINKDNNSYNQATSAYQEQVYTNAQNDINAVVQDILAQHKSIKPTIEIKAGSRIFIVPTNHMWFPKPRNNEVLMQYFND